MAVRYRKALSPSRSPPHTTCATQCQTLVLLAVRENLTAQGAVNFASEFLPAACTRTSGCAAAPKKPPASNFENSHADSRRIELTSLHSSGPIGAYVGVRGPVNRAAICGSEAWPMEQAQVDFRNRGGWKLGLGCSHCKPTTAPIRRCCPRSRHPRAQLHRAAPPQLALSGCREERQTRRLSSVVEKLD